MKIRIFENLLNGSSSIWICIKLLILQNNVWLSVFELPPPQTKFCELWVCEIKTSFIMWQSTTWKTFPMLFAQLADVVMFTFSAYPEAWRDTINSSTLSTSHVRWRNSRAAAHAVPSAKPGLGDGSLAPTQEHLHLQMVLEKPEGGRRIRLWDCSHLFPGDLHIKNGGFFLEKLVNAFEIHTGIFFIQFKPWRGGSVGYRIGECSFKNLYPLFVVWCLMVVSLLTFP